MPHGYLPRGGIHCNKGIGSRNIYQMQSPGTLLGTFDGKER